MALTRCLRRTATAAIAVVLVVAAPDTVRAQTAAAPVVEPAGTQGAFPDATFDVTFRKYTKPSNAFSPFYAWDAHMALDVTVTRQGANVVDVALIFQTVGTQAIGSRVSVGGTGYVIRAGYDRTLSANLSVSAGVSHLSSHLTRDLDEKTDEARAAGAPIPVVADPHEYNAVFLEGDRKFPSWRCAPEIDVSVQPLNFRFSGGQAASVRPVYLATHLTLWRSPDKSLRVETEHEFGSRSWNQISLVLELFARPASQRRFQLFLSASPGHGLHVSPIIGGLRDGVAAGVRMTFQSS